MITANALKLQTQHLFTNSQSVDYEKIITAWEAHFRGNSNGETRFQDGHPSELDDLVSLGILETFWGDHNFAVTEFGDKIFEPLHKDWYEALRSQPFVVPGLGITL
ncbi:MAG: hypothetical protein AAFQ89_23825 [Cyanobacteria bacterium J06626_18]